MVKVFQQTISFEYDWATFTKAIWQKYPNPFASHVLSSDVIDRQIDSETGVMTTTRLFLKRGILPAWGRHFLNVPEAFIIEKSIVDLRNQKMILVQKNLSHAKIMLVEERQTIHPNQNNPLSSTDIVQEGRFVSNTGWSAIKSRIESFGLNKFKDNTMKSSRGLLHVLEQLQKGPI
ncbi:hypothetical protein HK096_009881 [Nowakowskiella sp. JEL0078]|nr:hypothetical protein HK096_009881 [Nowakowskiella sp. JEL0078]